MKNMLRLFHLIPALLFLALASTTSCLGAIFPGNARAEATDSTGDLSWKTANNALTVSCWFKISVPSNVTITDNMVILVNNRTGTASSPYSYLIQYNVFTGNVEFSANGTATLVGTLISRPYLDRWYHVAVVRSGTSYTGYLDGRQVFTGNQDVGNSANTDGLSIGGWGNAKYLYGEVQEAAIYQTALSQEVITSLMFTDQDPTQIPQLRGYYKLAYSANTADNLKNFATTPAAGTDPLTKQGTGTLTFEQSNAGGEQSTFDSRKNGGRDAVSPLSGAYTWQQSVLSRPTQGIPIEFKIGYSSGSAFNSQTLGSFDPFASSILGSGWRNSFDIRVIPSLYFSPIAGTDSIGLMLWDGSMEVWDYDYNVFQYLPRHAEYRGEFAIVDATTCSWTTPDRLVYKFFRPDAGSVILRGRLKEIDDVNGNKITVTWNTTFGRINKVTDTAGTDWTFTYNGQSLLSTITGLGWTLTFTYDANSRLASKSITGPAAYTSTPALNTQWQFFYDATSGLLNRVMDPRGNNSVQVAYDKYGRKTTATDSLNRVTQTDYNLTGTRQITTTDAAGKKWVNTFDRRNHLLTRKDPLGNTFTNEYNANGNVSKTTDELLRITQFTYDARANMLTKTDALSRVWQWQYNHVLTNGVAWNKPTKDIRPATAEAPAGWETRYTYDPANGNLLLQDDNLGTLVTYTYSPKGLLLTAKDANNHTGSSTYTAEGFLLSRTDAANQTTNYTRTELGWTATQTNPLTQTTTYSYNINGQVVQVTDALTRTVKKAYDPNGNPVSDTDAKNQTTTYVFDSEDQRTSMTDRAGKVWGYTFNTRGLPETTSEPTRPDGSNPTYTKLYDDAGRLITETDPLGHSVSYQYDAVGNRTVTVDKLSRSWVKIFDVLNRVITDKDPLGNTTTTTFDEAGRVKAVTNPRGYVQTNDYDGRGRLNKWTDPAGFRWIYTYDGAGNILDIQDALNGHYGMTYGLRNERLTETNQDAKTWTYAYDELMRLRTQTDPNGVARTLTYDAGGRVSGVAFSTGRTHSFTYDLNNNPLTVTRTVGGVATPTTLTFDAMDRILSSTDAFNQAVSYGYNVAGRMQTIVYPGNKMLTRAYDAAGRLISLTDWAARVSSFGYDNADRLTSRTYPNGVTQTMSFDNAGRVTNLQHNQGATALIALTYAYDANGNKIMSTEAGLLNWTPPATYNETASVTAAGRLITRTDASDPTHAKDFTYQYDNSGNMIQASSSLRSYQLSYDEDNRVLTLGLQQAPQNHSIANRYDAFGRRISRTLDGTEARYVLDLGADMERILCDADASGNIVARYVHAGDLCYKEDAQSGALTCYHPDAQANIVRTTSSTGAMVSEYAYTPYGRSLGINGATTDPYRFVGSQGVMEELPNLHFMRARYYSAEFGMFLSTDSVRNIGPGWRPDAYCYTQGNPLSGIDPKGTFLDPITVTMAVGIYYGLEQTYGRTINLGLSYLDSMSGVAVGKVNPYDMFDDAVDEAAGKGLEAINLPGGDLFIGTARAISGQGSASLVKASAGYLPFAQTVIAAQHIYNFGSNVIYGMAQSLGMTGQNSTGTSMGTASSVGHTASATSSPVAANYATSTNANVIRAGATLSVPVAPTVSSSSSGGGGSSGRTITIRPGDTIGNLAYALGVSSAALLAANPQISNANNIRSGASLNVPNSSSGGGSSSKSSSSSSSVKKK